MRPRSNLRNQSYGCQERLSLARPEISLCYRFILYFHHYQTFTLVIKHYVSIEELMYLERTNRGLNTETSEWGLSI